LTELFNVAHLQFALVVALLYYSTSYKPLLLLLLKRQWRNNLAGGPWTF